MNDGDESATSGRAIYRLVCGCGLRTRWEKDLSAVKAWQRISNGKKQPLNPLSRRLDCCDEHEAVVQEKMPTGDVEHNAYT